MVVALMVLGVLAGVCRADEDGGGEKFAGKPAKKPRVVEVDLNQLPPDVAKQVQAVLKAAQKEAKGAPPKTPPGLAKKEEPPAPPAEPKKPGKPEKPKKPARTITLTEAIAIAEQTGRGQAVKAERRGEGAKARFEIDLIDKQGRRVEVEVSATGQLFQDEEPIKARPTEKPAAKPDKPFPKPPKPAGKPIPPGGGAE
jgi:uncharacterized membrane protein YkoI